MHHDGEYVIGDACADGCSSGCAVTELDRQSGKVGASKFFPVFRWDGRSVASDRQSTEGRSHPTVKSVSLTDWMVSLITPEGGTVLDMFAGTGPVASVARRREYQSILIDEDPESIGYILARLGEPVWGGPISGGLVQGDLFGEEVP